MLTLFEDAPGMYGPNDDPYDPDSAIGTIVLRREILEDLRKGPLSDYTDLEAAISVARQTQRQLEEFATDGNNIVDDDDMALMLRSLRAILGRLGVEMPDFPFRDLATFRSYWQRNGMTDAGSWQKRRNYLHSLFEPIYTAIDKLEDERHGSDLVSSVSPHKSLGWPSIDTEIVQLRRRFMISRTDQDYNAVGVACVRILELLGELVFSADRHLRDGEEVPARDKTKVRIGRYIEEVLPGAENAELRKLANAAAELAHRVKHAATPDRLRAGIAADAVIILASILRRLSDKVPIEG